MDTSKAAWVRFEHVGKLGARATLLDSDRNPLESFTPLVTHSVGGQAVKFDVVRPWLEMNGLQTVGMPSVWTHEDGTFLCPVEPA